METLLFGLVGRTLEHSYSQQYFTEKFAALQLDCKYRLFEFETIASIRNLPTNFPQLRGFNVTIPYKQSILPYLDALSDEARAVGAVNTVALHPNGRWTGYNTDIQGFTQSLRECLDSAPLPPALVLGTGGAAQAVSCGLLQLNPQAVFRLVSRNPRPPDILGYGELTPELIRTHPLIINTTPLGMYPDVDSIPLLPWAGLTPNHLLFDLVYNPPETPLLRKGRQLGCRTVNGLRMLRLQADAAWAIWQQTLRKEWGKTWP